MPALNPPADGIAIDGLQRGWSHILKATRDGQDRQARWHMMSASMQGAMAFQKGLGSVHSLSHSLGGVNPKLHHGTLNALFLPAVIRFNAQAASIQNDRRPWVCSATSSTVSSPAPWPIMATRPTRLWPPRKTTATCWKRPCDARPQGVLRSAPTVQNTAWSPRWSATSPRASAR